VSDVEKGMLPVGYLKKTLSFTYEQGIANATSPTI